MISDNACLPHIVQVTVQIHGLLFRFLLVFFSPFCELYFFTICITVCFSLQLLLTFDPILVEKVANLLYLVMQDNPNLQRLYLTGVFFFIMMYTGSNVLPVARWTETTASLNWTSVLALMPRVSSIVLIIDIVKWLSLSLFLLFFCPRFLKYTHLKQAFKSEEVSLAFCF